MAVKMHIVVIWVMTLCCMARRYQPSALHLHDSIHVQMEVGGSSETLLPTYQSS
jgi:hypothetical protein